MDNFWIVVYMIISIFCLILTDLAPTVLDASIHPLEPVLRSTFWLTTHVLIITISYAAFFLAFALGDVLMAFYLKDEKKFAATIQAGTLAIYRAIQIGVVLLAGGIILGGIWADYSWGRYWGWDPKETWAFITWVAYAAYLHARVTIGWRGRKAAWLCLLAGSTFIFNYVYINVWGTGKHTYSGL